VTKTATQRQAAYPGGRNNPARGRQAKRIPGVIDISPGCATTDASGPPNGIDPHVPHQREVEHDPTVVGAEAGNVVPAPADREIEALVPCEPNDGDNVSDVRRPHNQRRMAIDHRVVNLAAFFICLVARLNHLPAND
jgi:hypothetical protein